MKLNSSLIQVHRLCSSTYLCILQSLVIYSGFQGLDLSVDSAIYYQGAMV